MTVEFMKNVIDDLIEHGYGEYNLVLSHMEEIKGIDGDEDMIAITDDPIVAVLSHIDGEEIRIFGSKTSSEMLDLHEESIN